MIGGVAFAVWLLVFARSMQTGTFDLMIDNGARLLTGHVQVQHPDYQNEPRVDLSLPVAPAIAALQATGQFSHISARGQGFALVSGEQASFGAQIMGIQPEVEGAWSSLVAYLQAGRFIAARGEAFVGAIVARNLGLAVGDEMVVLGTARAGGIAALSVEVAGIFATGQSQLDRGIVQVHIDDFREAWDMGTDEAHAVVAIGRNVAASETGARQAAIRLPGAAVLAWQQLMPEADQMRDMKAVSTEVMFYVLAIIVGFSVVNSFMMVVFERTQEFGVLKAIGMKSMLLRLQLQLEAGFVALLGIAVGIAVSAVLIAMLAQVGVPLPGDLEDLYREFNMPSRLFPKFDWSAVQIAALLMFFGIQAAAFVPGRQIARLRPVDALRHAG